jgi:hypothetical protein
MMLMQPQTADLASGEWVCDGGDHAITISHRVLLGKNDQNERQLQLIATHK